MNMDEEFNNCPICNGECSYIEQVQVIYGKDDYTSHQRLDVTCKGLSLKPFKKKLDYRLNGIAVKIFFWCENGHTWEKEFFTHKGQSKVKGA